MEKLTTKAGTMREKKSVSQGSELKIPCDESASAFSPVRLRSGNQSGKPADRASRPKKARGFLRIRKRKYELNENRRRIYEL